MDKFPKMLSKNILTMVALASVCGFSPVAMATYCHPGGGGQLQWHGGCDGSSHYTFSKTIAQVNPSASASLPEPQVGDNLSLKIANYTQYYQGANRSGVLFLVENDNLNWTSGSKTYDTSITNVYFDMGGLLVANNNDIYNNGMKVQQDSGNGVEFSEYYTGNTSFEMPAVPPSAFDADYSFYSTGSNNFNKQANGVNTTSEYVMFWGVLANGKTFQDVVSALADGSFKVGINLSTLVTDHAYCDTKSIIKTTYLTDKCLNTVPLPAAAWLFGSALIGFVTISNRRRV